MRHVGNKTSTTFTHTFSPVELWPHTNEDRASPGQTNMYHSSSIHSLYLSVFLSCRTRRGFGAIIQSIACDLYLLRVDHKNVNTNQIFLRPHARHRPHIFNCFARTERSRTRFFAVPR